MSEVINPPIAETPPNPELLHPYLEEPALQARILYGANYLNPGETDLPETTAVQLTATETIQQKNNTTYARLTNASNNERKNFWQGREADDFNRQKAKWIKDTVELFQSAKGFFTESEQGQRWTNLFQSLRINSLEFNEASAESIFNNYFIGENKDTDAKKFISDIIAFHRKPDTTIDYQKLQKNLDGVKWIAHIFGEIGADVVSQLTDAEGKLLVPEQLEKLIREVNSKPAGQTQSRLNKLDEVEVRDLTYLWGEGVTARETPLPQGYRWHYKRLTGEPREFPGGEEIVNAVVNPNEIAASLKEAKPEKYGAIDTNSLAQEIIQEREQMIRALQSYGLGPNELTRVITDHINHYKSFINNTLASYGVKIPDIKATVFPISAKTAELYEPSGQAFAFVTHTLPIIFLNMERIVREAKAIAKDEQRILTTEELGRLTARLLAEINPHEYTHLTADITYWNLLKKEGDKETPVRILPGKLGLEVAKPDRQIPSNIREIDVRERGRGLMEAVTVELTNQWARSFSARLDLNAYPAERTVLHSLEDVLMTDQNISREEAFKKFVFAYFNPRGFRHLTEELSLPQKDNQGKITGFARPHFLSIIYALMEYEKQTATTRQTHPDYTISRNYITHELTDGQKAEIEMFLRGYNRKTTSIQLTPDAIAEIRKSIGAEPTNEHPAEQPKIPNVNATENLRAAHHYLDIIRDKTRYKSTTPDAMGFLEHDYGFKVRDIENGWFGVPSFVHAFNDRYQMPLALYLLNGNHAVTVLKPPYQENGQWKIKVYNPFHEGEEDIILPDHDELKRKIDANPYLDNPFSKKDVLLQNLGIYGNRAAINEILADTYNLTISDRNDLQQYANVFYKEKMAALQQDGKNCVPLASFMAVMLNPLKPGDTRFKREGLAKFYEDFGIHIRTYEEIMGKTV